jgi:peptidoglycan/LPS O-acetylase OafA/YrhL
MDNNKGRPGELPALTIARYFAALAVALFHYAAHGLEGYPWLHNIVANGYLGVPFFFVLSGFILVYVSGHGKPEARAFWVRRVARIYPVYLLAWALYGVLIFYLRGVDLRSIQFAAVHGGLSAVLLQGWVPGADRWNPPAWSLSCEALFYLLFPWITAALARFGTRWLWVSIAVSLAAWLGILHTFTLDGVLLEGTPLAVTWGYYLQRLPLASMPLFVLGATVGHLYLRGARLSPRWAWAFVAAIVLLLTQHATDRILYVPRDWWVAALMPPLIVSLAGVRLREGFAKSAGLMLGNASYGMYILQVPVWGLLWAALGEDDRGKPLWAALLFIAGLSALCCLIYVWFERPVESWVKDRWGRRPLPRGVLAH